MTYLDHAATTPMLPAVADVLTSALGRVGNASSLHDAGRAARRALEEARESVAEDLGARPSEVIFTSGGTESNNLAVKGLYWARRDFDSQRCVVLASTVEHHSVLDAVEWLAKHEGARVEWLPVDGEGRVSPGDFVAALDTNGDAIALATVMLANNEVGTIQPITELATPASEQRIPFHTDAVQALGQIPLRFDELGVTSLAATGHKIGGPPGVGVLLVARGADCVPLLHGGGHERRLRSGTVNVPGALAMAAAVREVVTRQEEHARELAALRDELIARVRAAVPDAVLNGPHPSRNFSEIPRASGRNGRNFAEIARGQPYDAPARLPGNAHFSFPGCEGDSLLMLLDAAGIQASTGSACASGVPEPSHVLVAMGVEPTLARSSLRFSLGHTSTKADVDSLVEGLPGAVERARAAGLGR